MRVVQASKRSSAMDHAQDSSAGTFVKKLFNMVTNEPDDVIRWIKNGTAFFISDTKRLSESHLPKYYRHGKFSSLIRQLNFYSFYKMQEGGQSIVYRHSFFREGRPDLLANIKRRGSGKAKDPLFDPLAPTHQHTASPTSVAPSPLSSPMMNSLNKTTPCRASLSTPGSRPILSLDRMSPSQKFVHSVPQSTPPLLKLNPGFNSNSSYSASPYHSISLDAKPKRVFDQVSRDNNLHGDHSRSKHVLREQDMLGLKNVFAVDEYQLSPDLDTCFNTDVVAKPLNVSFLARDCLKWSEHVDNGMTNSISQRQDNDALLLSCLDEEHSSSDSLWERPLSPLNLPDQSTWLDLAF